MTRRQILDKIEAVRNKVEESQFEILRAKISERKFHHHKSNRNIFVRSAIHKLRSKLLTEVGLILEPILENQKEINLLYLREIERLRKAIQTSSPEARGKKRNGRRDQKTEGKNSG
jgi:hypothetical protein